MWRGRKDAGDAPSQLMDLESRGSDISEASGLMPERIIVALTVIGQLREGVGLGRR